MLDNTRSAVISRSIRMNDAIRANELRVVGGDGEQLGIMSKSEAIKAAQDLNVDLVEISPNADPPVAKVIDWGKYQYQQMKQQKKNRQNNKVNDLKQMRFGLKIGANDLEIKVRKIRQFLDEGHKVKVQIFYRGREMAHKELGYDLIERVVESLGEDVVVEQKPQMAGRNLSITVRSK